MRLGASGAEKYRFGAFQCREGWVVRHNHLRTDVCLEGSTHAEGALAGPGHRSDLHPLRPGVEPDGVWRGRQYLSHPPQRLRARPESAQEGPPRLPDLLHGRAARSRRRHARATGSEPCRRAGAQGFLWASFRIPATNRGRDGENRQAGHLASRDPCCRCSASKGTRSRSGSEPRCSGHGSSG